MANEKLYEDMEPREKFEALWLKAGLHKRPGADALLYDLEKRGFFDLPASIKHHSNRFGGLATHGARRAVDTTNSASTIDRRISNPIWLILQGRYTPRQCGGLLCDAGWISRCRG